MAYRGDGGEDSNEKLMEIRELFEDAVDHAGDAHIEAHRAERFYHNSECEGQWETDDLAYLRDQLRPAFTFNITKPKVDTFMGMYADAQRAPIIAAASGKDDDVLLAEVINIVKDQVLEQAGHERLASRQFKTGTIAGECGLQVEVVPSNDGEGWIDVNLYRVMPFEMHWDIGSIEPDRSDANHVFWDRWMRKSEFKKAYPDFKDQWEFLSGNGGEDTGYSNSRGNVGSETGGEGSSWNLLEDYDDERFYRYYYDRRKNKIRVIRYEYKTFETKYYVRDPQTREKTPIEKEMVPRVRMMVTLGAGYELIEQVEEVVKVCEFAGMTILAEYDEAGPFEGFSIIDYCYDVDEETGTAYGLIRNLFDPQMELNKSKSLEIEYLAQSSAPGAIIEEDSVVNIEQFQDALRQAGGVAIAKRGAISEGRIIPDRPVTPASPMVAQRLQGAMNLLDEVSTIPSVANLTAAEHAQAGVTVAIRYHKSRQSVSDPFANFEDSQKRLVDVIAQAIVRAMPDDQIEFILAGDGQYELRDGRVIEMVEGPPLPQQQQQPQMQGMQGMQGMPQQQGPRMVEKRSADLRNVRQMKYNLDMEYSSENSTLRMLELEMLLTIERAKPGMVDPELLVERASTSRSTQERLKRFVEKQMAAAAQGQQVQAQSLEKQNQGYMQIEGAKIQETQRHNKAEEQIKLSDQQLRARLETMQNYIDADEHEKARLLDMAKFAMQQRTVQTEAYYNG